MIQQIICIPEFLDCHILDQFIKYLLIIFRMLKINPNSKEGLILKVKI